jgi:hypothetical protein
MSFVSRELVMGGQEAARTTEGGLPFCSWRNLLVHTAPLLAEGMVSCILYLHSDSFPGPSLVGAVGGIALLLWNPSIVDTLGTPV